MINAEIGGEEEVMNALNQIPEVIEIYGLYGVYDIIAIIETDTMDKLKDVVGTRIRQIDVVRATLTMIVVE